MMEEIISFYNSYADQLVFQRAINHARYQFVDNVARSMIKTHHAVLDLGCGIGTTSVIMSAYCKEVVAVDFAPRPLAMAERMDNIRYHCCDIADIRFDRTFDVICLFDVLEHIPTIRVPHVFSAITRHMADDTKLLIIVPYWKYLEHKKRYRPETIQIIDNPIRLGDLALWAEQHCLEIRHYEVLSLFHVCDYTYIRMKRDLKYDCLSILEEVNHEPLQEPTMHSPALGPGANPRSARAVEPAPGKAAWGGAH
jgi:trans-aconitate 2-methyltransferase